MIHSKLLSSNIYTHPKHSWALDGIDIPKKERAMMQSIANNLHSGRRMDEAQSEFLQSERYSEIQHECDLISGEYHRILGKYAQQLIVKKGLISKEDLETYSSPSNVVVPAEYYVYEQVFASRDKNGAIFFVGLSEVEAYANEVLS